jgi:putative intracellular protease/amidase
MSLLREFDRAKELIAAVCGALVLLDQAGILKYRRFCSDLQTHPLFREAIHVEASAVRDGDVITGLGTRIFHFSTLLIEALASQEKVIAYQRWAGVSLL